MVRIGIMGAMPEEVALLRDAMSEVGVERRGMREYLSGTIHGKEVVVVFSRWGKVAAASTATTLLERFDVDQLVFTGVAGAVDPALELGDIVVAFNLVQHDMDASALAGVKEFEVPLLGLSHFDVSGDLSAALTAAADRFLRTDLSAYVSEDDLRRFGIQQPRVHRGVIASGDQFVADAAKVTRLRERLPGLMCVEMEGAAVAQVAYEHCVPCAILRTISDKADHTAAVDFPAFVASIATPLSCGAVLRWLR